MLWKARRHAAIRPLQGIEKANMVFPLVSLTRKVLELSPRFQEIPPTGVVLPHDHGFYGILTRFFRTGRVFSPLVVLADVIQVVCFPERAGSESSVPAGVFTARGGDEADILYQS